LPPVQVHRVPKVLRDFKVHKENRGFPVPRESRVHQVQLDRTELAKRWWGPPVLKVTVAR
jgi:Cft2 family RNA processing exonuclease